MTTNVKVTLTTAAGSLGVEYMTVPTTPGGYVDMSEVGSRMRFGSWLLSHGDTIKIEFLDQIEPDYLTGEDERFLAAREE